MWTTEEPFSWCSMSSEYRSFRERQRRVLYVSRVLTHFHHLGTCLGPNCSKKGQCKTNKKSFSSVAGPDTGNQVGNCLSWPCLTLPFERGVKQEPLGCPHLVMFAACLSGAARCILMRDKHWNLGHWAYGLSRAKAIHFQDSV